MKRMLRALVPLVALLLSACGPDDVWVRGDRPAAKPGSIAVLPARLLQELPGAVTKEVFSENLAIGHIRLSGGYVVEEDLGRQVRSREIQLEGEPVYRKQATSWADEAIGGALDRAKLRWTRITLPDFRLPLPVRADVRGTTPLDGTDNVNLPRFTLRPAPLDAGALETLPPSVQAVIAPIVVHYYSHNGGWFIGQRWGCTGGSRVRLLWTMYDRRDGGVLAWGDLEARALAPYNNSPSSAQIQDLLLLAERRLQLELDRSLAR